MLEDRFLGWQVVVPNHQEMDRGARRTTFPARCSSRMFGERRVISLWMITPH